VAGYVTGGGNPDWQATHAAATRTAWAVQVLVDAGTTMVGKTITDESIHVKRDNRRSITYSEELIFPISATLQSTDRHHGIVGQESCHFQRDS
jgi:hypothetical protein